MQEEKGMPSSWGSEPLAKSSRCIEREVCSRVVQAAQQLLHIQPKIEAYSFIKFHELCNFVKESPNAESG